MDGNDEAMNISKSVLSDVVNTVILASAAQKPSNEDDSQSLITALESLTEESAKEIFEKDESDNVSAKTSKIIARFMGRTKEPRTPTPPSALHPKLQNLSEITFSSDDSNSEQLVIHWDNIESPTAEQKTSHKVMCEVEDEIFEDTLDEEMTTADVEKAGPSLKKGGRRKKSTPKKKSIDGLVKDSSVEDIVQDVDQIVMEFMKESETKEGVQGNEKNEDMHQGAVEKDINESTKVCELICLQRFLIR